MPNNTPAARILNAWVELETALRNALPVCSVAPPTQPTELLSALRLSHRIGPREEEQILVLRQARNRVAHDPDEPPEEEATGYESEVRALKELLGETRSGLCSEP